MDNASLLSGDCLHLLPSIADGSVQLVYFDPPFNVGLDYPAYDDNRDEGVYYNWLAQVIAHLHRVLSPTGCIWVQCGQSIQAEVYNLLKCQGLTWRNSVVWHYTFGPHQKKKFVPSWQMLHYFTVHKKNFTFNADLIRVPSARQLKYNDKRANSKGRLPDDVWTVSRICGTFGERIDGHSCQTPLEVLDRIILACSNPGDTVLDPMMGTGSSGEAALLCGRKYIGMELSEETASKAKQRIERCKEKFVFYPKNNE